jgi:hypothetical protein
MRRAREARARRIQARAPRRIAFREAGNPPQPLRDAATRRLTRANPQIFLIFSVDAIRIRPLRREKQVASRQPVRAAGDPHLS